MDVAQYVMVRVRIYEKENLGIFRGVEDISHHVSFKLWGCNNGFKGRLPHLLLEV
jgi:hypothetical protein